MVFAFALCACACVCVCKCVGARASEWMYVKLVAGAL